MTNREMLMVNLQVSSSEGSNTSEIERRQKRQRKERIEAAKMKRREELEWKPEDCAKPIGPLIKYTGKGVNKKCHYQKFEFYGVPYGLDDSVLVVPEDKRHKLYVAIIKDIYVQGEEGYVKVVMQWFYRPEDVDKSCLKYWRFKDQKDHIFYSFHQDEVPAESVKRPCLVYFVPDNEQVADHDDPEFIVRHVYDTDTRKLWKLTHDDFCFDQKYEIDFLLARTISRVEYIHDTLERQALEQSCEINVEITSPERSPEGNESFYKSILEKFGVLTGDSNRDKRLEELLEAVQDKCGDTRGCDFGFSWWPDAAVHAASSLEKSLYESLASDMPNYNHKLEVLVDKLKNSRMLASRFLNAKLKLEEVLTMTRDDSEKSDH